VRAVKREGKRTNSERGCPLFIYLALATILSGRFAVRLTIAGNYLPLPRARRDPTRALLASGFYGGHRFGSSLFLLSTPRAPPFDRPPAHDRRRAHRCRRSAAMVMAAAVAASCSFCPSRSAPTTSLVCLRRLCRCACMRARTCIHCTHTHTRARARACNARVVFRGNHPRHARERQNEYIARTILSQLSSHVTFSFALLKRNRSALRLAHQPENGRRRVSICRLASIRHSRR